MSTVRFGAVLASPSINSLVIPDLVVQASQASAVLISQIVIPKPRRYYVWVYDLEGEKVAVIA